LLGNGERREGEGHGGKDDRRNCGLVMYIKEVKKRNNEERKNEKFEGNKENGSFPHVAVEIFYVNNKNPNDEGNGSCDNISHVVTESGKSRR
jgi:hypothetical protein